MDGTQSRVRALKLRAHEALKRNDYEAAWQPVSDVLNMNMDDAQALYMAALIMRAKGHSGLSAQLLRRVAAMEPNELNVWSHFGGALHDIHAYDEAIEVFRYCVKLNPRDYSSYGNIAACFQMKGDFILALEYAEQALKRNAKHSNAKCVKAMASLGLGRWREGFELYKHMYGSQLKIRVYCEPEEPEWDGTPGKTLVVQCDQGIGDEIRFASVLPDVVRDCKQVIMDCNPRLEALFSRSFPEVTVYGTRKEHKDLTWPFEYEIDARYHISGLGRFYRHADSDFPRRPFLVPDVARRAKWTSMLGRYPRPWVGVAWIGGLIGTGREHRSVAASDWAPLMRHGGTFVDLSYHDSKAEAESAGILHFDIDQDDYDDTVALVDALDLVVCVPTAVLHAAGGLGKPAWVLVPKFPNWEFGLKREDMIWYPPNSVRLFRTDISDMASEYARLHRSGLEATARVHDPAELDRAPGEPAGADHAVIAPTVAHQPARPHRLHF